MVYGTDDGVYVSDLMDRSREPLKVLGLLDVTQVDVLEDTQLLIVLSGKLHLRLQGMSLTFDLGTTRTLCDHIPT